MKVKAPKEASQVASPPLFRFQLVKRDRKTAAAQTDIHTVGNQNRSSQTPQEQNTANSTYFNY